MKRFVILLFVSTSLLAQDTFFCPVPNLFQLTTLETEWPLDLIDIEDEEYETNPKATYCTRPMEMLDTIVLHHSETPSSTTAQEINQYHLNRGSPKDPWYMIAYSYVVNTPYPGENLPTSKVTVGRPIDIVGAHAGSNVYVSMDEEQSRLWSEGKVVCGKEGEDFKVDPSLIKGGKIKANVTTLGLVVIGNYSPKSISNPNGYSKKKPRFPTKDTQDMIARLSCQLQKKYPRLTKIRWHNYYHPTSCPGTIKDYVGQIKTLAKGYGCEFN